MKYLVSWMAYTNDFTPDKRQVNEQGPSHKLHRHQYKKNGYTLHHLLYSAPHDEPRAEGLANSLRRAFPGHVVQTRCMDIDDPIDTNLVLGQQMEFLASLDKDARIDLFFSAGTDVIRLGWFLASQSMRDRCRLFSIRSIEYNHHEHPEFFRVDFVQDQSLYVLFAKRQQPPPIPGKHFMGQALARVYALAERVAQAGKISVLLTGQTGTGKELLARHIHASSNRRDRPMQSVNCAALQTPQLLESRLFGHKKGAFTGAESDQEGLFAIAHKSTLFLDEIGDASPEVQSALLRVLEEGTFRPIGAREDQRTDVRVIAATHRDLEQEIERGKFRQDLYYRLAVAELELPPLAHWSRAERQQLIDHLARQLPREMKLPGLGLQFDDDALQALLDHPFPGNIRELRHLLSRLLVFSQGPVRLPDLPLKYRSGHRPASFHIHDVERQHIRKVFEHTRGNQAEAARLIGWSVNTLKGRCKDYGIRREDFA